MKMAPLLREDAAKFLQFSGTENFGFQFYDLIWLIIVNFSMLAINGGPVCQIGGLTDKKGIKSKLCGLQLKV